MLRSGLSVCGVVIATTVVFNLRNLVRFSLLDFTGSGNIGIIDPDDYESSVQVDLLGGEALPTYSDIVSHTRTNFRRFILRKLREQCHIDEWKNTPGHRRILKKKVVSIMRLNNPDIRDEDVYMHGDAIVELFFVPTKCDFECRKMRTARNVIETQRLYDRPVWVGSFTRFLLGQPLWLDPRGPPQ